MRNRYILYFSISLLMLGITKPAQALEMKKLYPIASWDAQRIDSMRCDFVVTFENGYRISLANDQKNRDLILTLSSKKQDFNPEQIYQTDIYVDANIGIATKARPYDFKNISFNVGDKTEFFNNLSGAQELSLGLDETLYIFSFGDHAFSPSLLESCKKTNLQDIDNVKVDDSAFKRILSKLDFTEDDAVPNPPSGPVSSAPIAQSNDAAARSLTGAMDALSQAEKSQEDGRVLTNLFTDYVSDISNTNPEFKHDAYSLPRRDALPSDAAQSDVFVNPDQTYLDQEQSQSEQYPENGPMVKSVNDMLEDNARIVNEAMLSEARDFERGLLESLNESERKLLEDTGEVNMNPNTRTESFSEYMMTTANPDYQRDEPIRRDINEIPADEIPAELQGIQEFLVQGDEKTDTEDENKELIDSLLIQLALLEREKEALRLRQREEPDALSVIRSCSKEKSAIFTLQEQLETVETKNFDLRKQQEIANDMVQACSGVLPMDEGLNEGMIDEFDLDAGIQDGGDEVALPKTIENADISEEKPQSSSTEDTNINDGGQAEPVEPTLDILDTPINDLENLDEDSLLLDSKPDLEPQPPEDIESDIIEPSNTDIYDSQEETQAPETMETPALEETILETEEFEPSTQNSEPTLNTDEVFEEAPTDFDEFNDTFRDKPNLYENMNEELDSTVQEMMRMEQEIGTDLDGDTPENMDIEDILQIEEELNRHQEMLDEN